MAKVLPSDISKTIDVESESFESINEVRKARQYTWNEYFQHMRNYREGLISLLDKDMEPSLCVHKSIQTVSTLLPKWCSNTAQNMSQIIEHGDISQLLCKTKKDNFCWKLNKLRELYDDPDITIDVNEVAKRCDLPEDNMDFLLRQMLTYDFIPIAGSDMCEGCKDYAPKSKSALIIGGGPSLETYNHLKLLKEKGFNGDIFVVSKVIKDVLDAGIVPDFVGALDAEEFDTSFFNHDIVKENMDKITALFGTNIHPTTVDIWTGPKYFFSGYISDTESPNISHIFHLLTKTSNISVAGNIGSCMCNVAAFMGYDEIVTIGMDLSFPTKQAMKDYFPHATDADWERTLSFGNEERPMYKRMRNPIFNKQYYVDSVFESYKDSHLSWAKSLAFHGIKSINCSEQGALHGKHVESMKFEEYLNNNAL